MSGEQGLPRWAERLRAPERRAEAEIAIEQALIVLEGERPSVDQLSDLADAIDSYNDGSFGVAAELAMGALRHRALPKARRPASLARSLPDLKAAFAATRRFVRSAGTKPPR